MNHCVRYLVGVMVHFLFCPAGCLPGLFLYPSARRLLIPPLWSIYQGNSCDNLSQLLPEPSEPFGVAEQFGNCVPAQLSNRWTTARFGQNDEPRRPLPY